ncbi:MAG TPA: thiamine diphosphokinase [Patescibacteria group bacterium]|nr:thiamine diphosphokinase [Patescibacteria group bacterium]
MGHALVLADGTCGSAEALDAAWPGWSDGIAWVVAADGGARHAAGLGCSLDLWVGDGDSLGEDALTVLAATGTPIRRLAVDKDESDTELALLAAIETGARRVTILGALGGARFDHALANVWLLADPRVAGRDIRIVDVDARIRLVGAGRHSLRGRIGDLVTIIPFGADTGRVTTAGLRYPLRAEPLPLGPSRGLSNVRASGAASIELEAGRLLVAETPVTLLG